MGLVAGVALTLEADTSSPGEKSGTNDYWDCLQKITDSAAPVMLVIKTIGSRPKHECVCGDGMCKALFAVGCVGIVSNSPVRDLEAIKKTGIAIFGSGTVTSHPASIYQWSREPVTISGVTIAEGDLIVGDGDGVIKVPEKYHAGIVEACLVSRDFESRVHTFFRRRDKTPTEKREFVIKLAKVREEKCRRIFEGIVEGA